MTIDSSSAKSLDVFIANCSFLVVVSELCANIQTKVFVWIVHQTAQYHPNSIAPIPAYHLSNTASRLLLTERHVFAHLFQFSDRSEKLHMYVTSSTSTASNEFCRHSSISLRHLSVRRANVCSLAIIVTSMEEPRTSSSKNFWQSSGNCTSCQHQSVRFHHGPLYLMSLASNSGPLLHE